MAPPNLLGLNIVHPAQSHSSSVSDSQDLLSAPPYSDLAAAQLDLWTNLSFESDEPLIHTDNEKNFNHKKLTSRSDDEEDLNLQAGTAAHDAHENVVTGTNIATTHNDDSGSMHAPNASSFDLNHLLSGFGIDPFATPHSLSSLPSEVPSLAHLLSLHPQQGGAGFQPSPITAIPPSSLQQQHDIPPPPAKRLRSRKTSVSTVDSPDTPYDPSFPDSDPNTATPVTPAEDKRRRNTAASARFRMKKKEREAALEKKAKELEVRVNELERECEGLRRENGWLKGLVVGVTGAQPPSVGKKRSREELEVGSVSVISH